MYFGRPGPQCRGVFDWWIAWLLGLAALMRARYHRPPDFFPRDGADASALLSGNWLTHDLAPVIESILMPATTSAMLEPIPTRPFAIAVGVGALASLAAGLGVAVGAGGTGDVLAWVGMALAGGVLLALVPMIGPPLVTPDRWGMAVLLVSGVRTMLAMMAMLVLIEVAGLPRRPVVMGVLVGTVVMMVIEASAAVYLLSKRERGRMAAASSAAGRQA